MDNQIASALIAGFIPLLTPLLKFLLEANVQFKNKKSHNNSIETQQYQLVFIPIQRILLFSNKNDQLSEIQETINQNLELVPNQLLETFKCCLEKKEVVDDFKKQIDTGYIILNNKLKYSNSKLDSKKIESNNRIIEISNKAIKQSAKTFVAAIIIVTGSFILAILNLLNIINVHEYFTTALNIFAFIVELFPFFVYIVKVIIEYIKYDLKNSA